jgi:periplasmic divalent cation tolerance protein
LQEENQKMDSEYILVLITASSAEEGQKISESLVGQKLAACVNTLPAVQSLFNWEGRTSQEQEVLLIAKTRASLFHEHVVPAVKALHSYDVPEIIALPILMGSQDYLDWIGAETRQP